MDRHRITLLAESSSPLPEANELGVAVARAMDGVYSAWEDYLQSVGRTDPTLKDDPVLTPEMLSDFVGVLVPLIKNTAAFTRGHKKWSTKAHSKKVMKVTAKAYT